MTQAQANRRARELEQIAADHSTDERLMVAIEMVSGALFTDRCECPASVQCGHNAAENLWADASPDAEALLRLFFHDTWGGLGPEPLWWGEGRWRITD